MPDHHVQSPGIEIPFSNNCIRVRAVNTTTRMVCDAEAFVQPVVRNHTKLNFPTLCFLLERQTVNGTRYVLYDLGARKDFWNGSPISKSMIGNHVPGLEVEKGVQDVLVEGGIELDHLGMRIHAHSRPQPHIVRLNLTIQPRRNYLESLALGSCWRCLHVPRFN